jgi:hypothetical protein
MVPVAAICTNNLNAFPPCIHHKIDEPSVRVLQPIYYTQFVMICKDAKIDNFFIKSLLKKWKLQKNEKVIKNY